MLTNVQMLNKEPEDMITWVQWGLSLNEKLINQKTPAEIFLIHSV